MQYRFTQTILHSRPARSLWTVPDAVRAICVRRVALFERSEFHAPANDTLVKKSGARKPARRQAADEIFPRKIGKKRLVHDYV